MKTVSLELADIIDCILFDYTEHKQVSTKYIELKSDLSKLVEIAYSQTISPLITFNSECIFELPYRSMGAINTTHLFGIDEIIILSFYLKNRSRYKNVLDLGANIGLHSIFLGKLGYNVRAYEADPDTYDVLLSNIKLNNLVNVEAINSAVASYDGEAEFTRVCGNLTGSHLSGAKSHPYGELEKFSVNVVGISKYFELFDLVKMDIEGQEADVFCSIPFTTLAKVDIIMEINGDDNALAVFQYANMACVNLFVQRNAWSKALTLEDLPRSHRDGSVFVTSKDSMPW